MEQLTITWVIRMLESRTNRITSELGDSSVSRSVTRGTQQERVVSPLLGLIMVNKILLTFEIEIIKSGAFTEDLVVVTVGKDLSTVSDIMAAALKELSNLAEEYGLGVEPSKPALILFKRKYKTLKFRLPKMEGKVLNLSKETIYLGVLLNSTLYCARKMEERIKAKKCIMHTQKNVW